MFSGQHGLIILVALNCNRCFLIVIGQALRENGAVPQIWAFTLFLDVDSHCFDVSTLMHFFDFY